MAHLPVTGTPPPTRFRPPEIPMAMKSKAWGLIAIFLGLVAVMVSVDLSSNFSVLCNTRAKFKRFRELERIASIVRNFTPATRSHAELVAFVSRADPTLVTTNKTGGVEYTILAEKPIYYDRAATFTDLNSPYIWPRKIHGVSAFYMTWRGDIKSWDTDGGRPMDSR